MDAKTAIGATIRLLREKAELSQERLAERAGITYQYLSAIENGKENFTIGILEGLAAGLSVSLPALVERTYASPSPAPLLKPEFFIQRTKLPPKLTIPEMESAFNETHLIVRLINTTLIRVAQRPLSAYIQGNNFSGIVANILCDAFSRLTPYKHNHDQRYPDLICKNAKGAAVAGLEIKTTIRPGKGGESHNGHSGWHLVACFSLDKVSGDIRFTHVMFADLIGHGKSGADWKYVGSKINEATGSQRTETYTTTPEGTAKLRHGTVYLDTSVIDTIRWRTAPAVPVPLYSPFKQKQKP
jgi:transcriptional regulator with XRE-family HTH domain